MKKEFYRSTYSDVFDFFQETSKRYDTDLFNPYWSFAHHILKHILYLHISFHFKRGEKIFFFDAGGGTGNWSNYLCQLSPNISGTIFDMNKFMLNYAFLKLSKNSNQINFIEGNLEEVNDFPLRKSNLLLCMHNVIGLGRDTNVILKNLYNQVEYGGISFIMAPNKYHGLNFNKSNLLEKERIIHDGTVKFKKDMPEMYCFTPSELTTILDQIGYRSVKVLGFPILTGPELADAVLMKTKTKNLNLIDTKSRKFLLEVEKKLSLNPNFANFGKSSLIAICIK